MDKKTFEKNVLCRCIHLSFFTVCVLRFPFIILPKASRFLENENIFKHANACARILKPNGNLALMLYHHNARLLQSDTNWSLSNLFLIFESNF